MTEEMYAKLKAPTRKARRDHPLWLSIVLFAVPCLLFVAGLWYVAWYGFHWHAHTAALSESTKHSYYFGAVQGTVEGEPTALTVEHTYQLYEMLTRQRSKLQKNPPAEDPRIRLEYDDGAVLEVWEAKLENAKREYGVFWRFTGYDGKVWMYDTDHLTYRDVWIVAAPQQNAGAQP